MNGGSNYVFYSYGDGTWGPTLRPIIGTYHLAPDVVKNQLERMYKNGQRRIALCLWFFPGATSPEIPDVSNHVCNSAGGQLCARAQENLVEVLKLIRQIGFKRLHFRFAQQYLADPSKWATWNETQYQENRSFIFSTRAIVEAHFSLLKIYDLGMELLGDADSISSMYVNRLWKEYSDLYGAGDSYAFSAAADVAGHRIGKMISDFKALSLPLPFAYAEDIYDNEFVALQGLANTLTSLGEHAKPVFIQECYYNDPSSAAEIKSAKSKLNLRGIFQWPEVKGQVGLKGPVFTPKFNNYLAI